MQGWSDVRDRLEKVVMTLLTESFPQARVNQVVIRPDKDSDGDSILRITVVMASEPKQLDPSRLASFTSLLQPKLAEVAAAGFPVMSFVAEREAGKLHLEAA